MMQTKLSRHQRTILRILAEELMNGFRTYYNFIRPHMSLEGRTPAEASRLDLKLGENKWLSLIQKASNFNK